MEIFLGRQPIFNLNEQIVAYELLYRNEQTNNFPNIDPDEATIRVVNNAFITMDFDEVTNGRPAFVNFTENILLDSFMDNLDPTRVVIEVLEGVELTKSVVERIGELKARGFVIALDDFVLEKDIACYKKLFESVDYIKIDFLNTSVAERMEIESVVKEQFPHIELLAEKVETHQQFRVAVESGYTLFQGYFFQKPQVISARDIPTNVLQYLQVLALLREEEPKINELTEQIERDIALSYKLIRLINNTGKRYTRKVRTIKQALVMIGLSDLRRWLFVITMKDLMDYKRPDIFKELLEQSLYRAKVCNILALRKRLENHSEYFLMGLFSLIDTILSRPMEKILGQMPLSEDIARTLLGRETSMSAYLTFSIALVNADFEKAILLGEQLQLTPSDILEIANEAERWAKETFENFNIN